MADTIKGLIVDPTTQTVEEIAVPLTEDGALIDMAAARQILSWPSIAATELMPGMGVLYDPNVPPNEAARKVWGFGRGREIFGGKGVIFGRGKRATDCPISIEDARETVVFPKRTGKY